MISYAFFSMHSVTFLLSRQHQVGSRIPAVPVRLQFSQFVISSLHRWNPMYPYIIFLGYKPAYFVGLCVQQATHLQKYQISRPQCTSNNNTSRHINQPIFHALQLNFAFNNYTRIQRIGMHRELNEEDPTHQPQPQLKSPNIQHLQHGNSSNSQKARKIKNITKMTDGEHWQNGSAEEQTKEGFSKKNPVNDREEALNFFGDSVEGKQKSSRPGQQNLFKRTYSFYEDEQAIQSSNNQELVQPQVSELEQRTETGKNKKEPPQKSDIIEQQDRNKFKRLLTSAEQYLKILKYSNYLHLIRFLFIGLIYYNLSFKKFSPNPDPRFTKIVNNSNARSEEGNQNGYFMPWNAMIYFLSGSIDIISTIGYISSIKLLQSDIKTLKARWETEERALKKKDATKSGSVAPDEIANIQFEPEPEIHQSLERGERALRLGKQSVYSSVYSTLRSFKYKNRDQAAPFKISKIMHTCATFLFFGRMALIQLYDFQQFIITINDSVLAGEICLWLFLFFAYFAVFEVDYFVIESSTGPYIKVDRFYFQRIIHSYQIFWTWRRNFSLFYQAGMLYGLCLIGFELGLHIQKKSYAISVIFFSFLMCWVTNCMVLYRNSKIVADSKSFIDSNSNLQKPVGEPTLYQLEKFNCNHNMFPYRNLSLLGIYAKHSKKFDNYLAMLNRIALFVLFMAMMRESDDENVSTRPLWFVAYVVGFGFFFMGEFLKFNRLMASKINLLDSFKYKQIKVDVERRKHFVVEPNLQNEQPPKITGEKTVPEDKPENQSRTGRNKSSRSSDCSICLLEYGDDQSVIVVCCGHIFHEQCLIDWLKHKKECPLCRLNISEFYEEVSF